jgi:hypothetical protein
MDAWTVIRIVTQIAGGLMMLFGAILLASGLKKDQWKMAVQGVFFVSMGQFILLMCVLAHIAGK